jgi:hypothetical protein
MRRKHSTPVNNKSIRDFFSTVQPSSSTLASRPQPESLAVDNTIPGAGALNAAKGRKNNESIKDSNSERAPQRRHNVSTTSANTTSVHVDVSIGEESQRISYPGNSSRSTVENQLTDVYGAGFLQQNGINVLGEILVAGEYVYKKAIGASGKDCYVVKADQLVSDTKGFDVCSNTWKARV